MPPMRWWTEEAPSGFADWLWHVGMAVMAGVEVFLACGVIVSFGVAGRDESFPYALWTLVLAGLAYLFGRWWMARWQERHPPC